MIDRGSRIMSADEIGARNHLLGRLRPTELELLAPMLGVLEPAVGDVLFESGSPVDITYFPSGAALASFRVLMPDGDSVETAMIGREGAVGGIVSQGRLPAFSRAVVQHRGLFIRVSTAKLEEAKVKSWPIRHLFARYADCLLAQVFQATACNAAHGIEQRAAKWLLAAHDRTADHEVPLTQDQLAGMLGVGRSYINRVIAAWKESGILQWRRGALSIIDLDALRRRSCACNDAVRAHFDAVLAGAYPNGDD